MGVNRPRKILSIKDLKDSRFCHQVSALYLICNTINSRCQDKCLSESTVYFRLKFGQYILVTAGMAKEITQMIGCLFVKAVDSKKAVSGFIHTYDTRFS